MGCQRMVLVGDPKQLPATVFSATAERFGYGKSLFQRLQQSDFQVDSMINSADVIDQSASGELAEYAVPYASCHRGVPFERVLRWWR